MDIRRARLSKIIKEAWLPNVEVSGTQKLRFVDQLIAKGVTVQTEPKTNADRIRAMSDEQLAKLFMDFSENLLNEYGVGAEAMTAEYVLYWLKQPAEE